MQFLLFTELESRESRIHDIHTLVYRLPKANFNILMLLIKHLCK